MSVARPGNVEMSGMVGSTGACRGTMGEELGPTCGKVEYVLVTQPAPASSALPAPTRAE